ncbi:LPXTG cell wall anchor domain-containing protein [Caenimonas soli]|uniref:LPXTG cell wall anchor domain-containing protein n=1 Tax=Caenimonas soli TaxID=2735555 RepID=UPI001A9AEFE6|nr:LPXTG cell wall anchor domain-containing protein [Caenimonas soli]
MDTNLILIGVVVLVLLAAAGWLLMRKKESQTLEKRFGSEYNRAVEELGSRPKAEAELKARQKRVEQLHIAPLAPAEAQRFSESWRALQGRFVDNPRGVLSDADQLVRELMQKRGYPMGDFDRRAADISVDHPAVVDHYRAAHDIALRDRHGDVDTEGMRQAVIHYRALFAELLEVEEPQPVRAKETDKPEQQSQDQKHVETQS